MDGLLIWTVFWGGFPNYDQNQPGFLHILRCFRHCSSKPVPCRQSSSLPYAFAAAGFQPGRCPLNKPRTQNTPLIYLVMVSECMRRKDTKLQQRRTLTQAAHSHLECRMFLKTPAKCLSRFFVTRNYHPGARGAKNLGGKHILFLVCSSSCLDLYSVPSPTSFFDLTMWHSPEVSCRRVKLYS